MPMSDWRGAQTQMAIPSAAGQQPRRLPRACVRPRPRGAAAGAPSPPSSSALVAALPPSALPPSPRPFVLPLSSAPEVDVCPGGVGPGCVSNSFVGVAHASGHKRTPAKIMSGACGMRPFVGIRARVTSLMGGGQAIAYGPGGRGISGPCPTSAAPPPPPNIRNLFLEKNENH